MATIEQPLRFEERQKYMCAGRVLDDIVTRLYATLVVRASYRLSDNEKAIDDVTIQSTSSARIELLLYKKIVAREAKRPTGWITRRANRYAIALVRLRHQIDKAEDHGVARRTPLSRDATTESKTLALRASVAELHRMLLR
ncbi:hypothetical protein BIW11_03534 [Tropilaelaps mercedesae]|uniref:Uncharacterized protein n=1 Tax=Tropilaelaps mercedesae TaxID=418985 RepID=A0A1V9XJM3_9ACAR|nr:hypothetical protein BIW11_03534 [Tropilaelaps mercedesae]